jgi:hypothetical protein
MISDETFGDFMGSDLNGKVDSVALFLSYSLY